MIPKENKPTAEQLRPIAKTDSSYKIFMSLLKNRIEKHLQTNDLFNELQSGFTKARCVEDNPVILNECKELAYKKRKQLIVFSIDFKKAYDSIKREQILEMLKFYKIDGNIINSIVSIYTGDETTITLRDNIQMKFSISSGIRQGCTLSTTIFKMITYRIIDEITKRCKSFCFYDTKIGCLFFADDGLILTNTKAELEFNITLIKQVSLNYGLRINDKKAR